MGMPNSDWLWEVHHKGSLSNESIVCSSVGDDAVEKRKRKKKKEKKKEEKRKEKKGPTPKTTTITFGSCFRTLAVILVQIFLTINKQ